MPDAITPKRIIDPSGKRSRHELPFRSNYLLLFILAAVLAGCRLNQPASQEATPVPTQVQSTATSPYPYPQAATPFQPQAPTSYPPPAAATDSGPTRYPAPATQETSAALPYPEPALTQVAQGVPTQSPTATSTPTPNAQPYPIQTTPAQIDSSATAYPGPLAAATATLTPLTYPGPQDTPVAGSPLQQASPTAPAYPGPAQTITPLPQGTPASTIALVTASPTLSPTVVRTEFQPSDPADFTLISDRPRLITFYADWAPNSDVMAPVINNLEGRYREQISFIYLNLEDPANSLFKELLKLQLPPAFFLLNPQGNVIRSWSGIVSIDELDVAIRSNLLP